MRRSAASFGALSQGGTDRFHIFQSWRARPYQLLCVDDPRFEEILRRCTRPCSCLLCMQLPLRRFWTSEESQKPLADPLKYCCGCARIRGRTSVLCQPCRHGLRWQGLWVVGRDGIAGPRAFFCCPRSDINHRLTVERRHCCGRVCAPSASASSAHSELW